MVAKGKSLASYQHSWQAGEVPCFHSKTAPLGQAMSAGSKYVTSVISSTQRAKADILRLQRMRL